MRKYYIDNIRWLCIWMLFPYHIFMIYNSFGENFYIKGQGILQTTGFIIATSPWFMPLLFTIAGMSSAYALQRRSLRAYLKERVFKLLIPFIFGLLLVVPTQTYFAEKFHNGYTGTYWQQYLLFFTKETDLTGYSGGFTPGHLWFVFYLFMVLLLALPLMLACQRSKKQLLFEKLPLPCVCLCFVIPLLMAPILDVGGKSLGEFFAYFILGNLLLSKDESLKKLERYRWFLMLFALGLGAVLLTLWFSWWLNIYKAPQLLYDIMVRIYGWMSILAILAMARRYINVSNRFTQYMTGASFPVYIFHQTWIIAVAYYVFQFTNNAFAQMGLILVFSVLGTFVTYEFCKRIPIARLMFGIKSTAYPKMHNHISGKV